MARFHTLLATGILILGARALASADISAKSDPFPPLQPLTKTAPLIIEKALFADEDKPIILKPVYHPDLDKINILNPVYHPKTDRLIIRGLDLRTSQTKTK